MPLCPLPPDSPFWFPTAPGITQLPVEPPITPNEQPEPANSIPVEGGFDPLNPPCELWEDLPTDTPAVPAAEMAVEQLVPVVKLEILQVFASRTALAAERGVINIPQVTDVTIVSRTTIQIFELSARIVTFPVKTKISVQDTAPAIRAEAVEMFNLLSMGSDMYA